MLIMNANLLGHIADNPYPGATYDPGLWPTYPPIVHQGSSSAQLQAFTDWWSRDGIASHILTSRLSPSVLGCLPLQMIGCVSAVLLELSTLRSVTNMARVIILQ